MKDNSYKRLKDYDFSDAKPVSQIPALVKLQAEHAKSRITIRLDQEVLNAFRAQAEKTGGSYQSMINDALKQHLLGADLVKTVRETIRRELRAA
jgi:uncharacterized protein (DUF4415 family)